MANQTSLLASLKSILPESAWPWVIPALKHDRLIWDTLSDPQFFKQASTEITEPRDWSPSQLALIMLSGSKPDAINKEILKEAQSTLDQCLHEQSPPVQAEMSFKQASLLALGLYHRNKDNDWQEIEETLNANNQQLSGWFTPMAILLGWVESQSELIHTLFNLNTSSGLIPLIIHAVISQPMPPEDTLALLQRVLADMSLFEATSLLSYLKRFQPELSMRLANSWLETHPLPSIDGTAFNIGGQLSQVSNCLLSAELFSLAGQMHKAESFRSQSLEYLNNIQVDVTNQLVGETNQTNNIEQALSLWTRFSAPADVTPPAGLVVKLLQAGRTEDSLTLLPDTEGNTQTPLRWMSNIYQALEKDDIPQARLFGHQTLNSFIEIYQADSSSLEKILGSQRDVLSFLSELIHQLTDLALYKEAYQAAQLASHIQPNDPQVLMTLTKTSRSAGEYDIAIQAAELAVAIDPTNPEFRRQLAQSLEISGLWTTSLKERQAILEHRFTQSGTTTWPTSEDLLALANCSVHADQPQQAFDVCQKAIELDPSNGHAHAILGEALSALGEDEQAMEHFKLATQLAPHKASPWLSLSNAFQRSGYIEKSIETLRTATHAVPDDPSIFFALGKVHIAGNSLSQAQSALDRAYQLVSRPNIVFLQSKLKDGNQTNAELFVRNREQQCEIALAYGDVLVQLGHPEQSNQVYESAYHAYPSYPGLAYIYAKSLMEIGDDNAALGPLAIAVAAEPSEALPYVHYARTLIAAKVHPEEAVQALHRALEIIKTQQIDPKEDSKETHELAVALLAQAQEATGELQASLHSYTQALETNLAKDEEWRTTLAIGMGRVALQLGQPEVAIAALQDTERGEIQNTEVAQILSESYSEISLKQEAVYAARTAVHLSPDNVDILAWFAERAIELGVIAEAVPALTSAAQLDPQRTDLIIRLGQVLARMEKHEAARKAFLSALSSPYSNPEDLYQAADGLSDLGDNESAANCLERALELQPHPPLSLILELANAYASAGKTELAIKTIDKGVDQDPENALLHTYKADLLGKRGHQDAARACLEHALILEPENPLVHLRIAYVLREQSDLISAYDHAMKAVENLNLGAFSLVARGLAAELARSTVQEGSIQQILEPTDQLEDEQIPPELSLLDQPSLFDYHCILAESALDREEQIAAATALNEAYSLEQEHPRVLALQSRMALRQGDRESSLQFLTSAVENIETAEQEDSLSDLSPSSLLGIALTAIELYKWDLAFEILDRAITLSPNDSYLYLQRSRLYVTRAEFQRLCQSLEIVTHAPGAVALSPRTYRIFEESIQETVNSLSGDLQAEIPLSIRRWKSRGAVAYQPTQEAFQDLENLLSEPSDQAALIYALSLNGDINTTAKLYHNIQSSAESETLHHSIYAAYALALSIAGGDMIAGEHAMEAIQSAIVQNQTEPIYYVIQAKVAEVVGDWMASLTAMETALSLWPDEPRWQSYIAQISLLNDDFPEAINHFESAIAMEPAYLQHYIDLSNANLRAGDGDQAIATLNQAIKIAPDKVEAYLALASAQFENRNYSQAVKNAKLAANLAPDQLDPLLLSAKIALKMDDPGKAKSYAEAALRIKPDNPEALHLQAQSLSMTGDAERALEIVEKAIPLSSDRLPLLLQRAELISQFEGPEANLTELKSISVDYPDEPIVLAPLAEALAEEGNSGEAIQAAQQALRRSSGQLPLDEQAKLHHLLGLLLRQSGQLDQSIHHLSEAIRIAPNSLDNYLELGITQEERRQHGQALETYQKAIRIYPTDPRPYYQAGLLLKASRDYPAAESMLRRAAEKAPDDITIHRQLAALVALNLVHSRQPVSTDV